MVGAVNEIQYVKYSAYHLAENKHSLNGGYKISALLHSLGGTLYSLRISILGFFGSQKAVVRISTPLAAS